jgi:hypothetical protein
MFQLALVDSPECSLYEFVTNKNHAKTYSNDIFYFFNPLHVNEVMQTLRLLLPPNPASLVERVGANAISAKVRSSGDMGESAK